jgi:hypothetical protein
MPHILAKKDWSWAASTTVVEVSEDMLAVGYGEDLKRNE